MFNPQARNLASEKKNGEFRIKTLASVLLHVFFECFFDCFAKSPLAAKLLNNKNLEFRPQISINIDGGFNFPLRFPHNLAHRLHHVSVSELRHKNTSPSNRQTYKYRKQNSITERR